MMAHCASKNLLRGCLLFLFFSITVSRKKDDGPVKPEERQEPETSYSVPLPLVMIGAFGNQIVNEPEVNGEMTLAATDGAVQYDGGIGIRSGSSQLLFDKSTTDMKPGTPNNMDLDTSFLTFPEEEDRILYAPYSDKSLVRNHLIYNPARDMGHYPSRSEQVELNLNGSYDGLYVFMEKSKRDKNRIDINNLKPEEI